MRRILWWLTVPLFQTALLALGSPSGVEREPNAPLVIPEEREFLERDPEWAAKKFFELREQFLNKTPAELAKEGYKPGSLLRISKLLATRREEEIREAAERLGLVGKEEELLWRERGKDIFKAALNAYLLARGVKNGYENSGVGDTYSFGFVFEKWSGKNDEAGGNREKKSWRLTKEVSIGNGTNDEAIWSTMAKRIVFILGSEALREEVVAELRGWLPEVAGKLRKVVLEESELRSREFEEQSRRVIRLRKVIRKLGGRVPPIAIVEDSLGIRVVGGSISSKIEVGLETAKRLSDEELVFAIVSEAFAGGASSRQLAAAFAIFPKILADILYVSLARYDSRRAAQQSEKMSGEKLEGRAAALRRVMDGKTVTGKAVSAISRQYLYRIIKGVTRRYLRYVADKTFAKGSIGGQEYIGAVIERIALITTSPFEPTWRLVGSTTLLERAAPAEDMTYLERIMALERGFFASQIDVVKDDSADFLRETLESGMLAIEASKSALTGVMKILKNGAKVVGVWEKTATKKAKAKK